MFVTRNAWARANENLHDALRKAQLEEAARIVTEQRSKSLATRLADAEKQIAFLERVLDRQRGPARVAHAGVPKKQQGPLHMRLVLVSREEAALLVPGVKHDSTGTVGSFEWGADSIGVKVQESKMYGLGGMLKEDW